MDEESHHSFNVRRNYPTALECLQETTPPFIKKTNSDTNISQHKQTYASKLIHEVR